MTNDRSNAHAQYKLQYNPHHTVSPTRGVDLGSKDKDEPIPPKETNIKRKARMFRWRYICENSVYVNISADTCLDSAPGDVKESVTIHHPVRYDIVR